MPRGDGFRHAFYRHYYVYRSARSERSVIATVYRLISSMILPVWRFPVCGVSGAPPPRGPAGISRLPHSVMRDHLRLRCGSIMHALVSYAQLRCVNATANFTESRAHGTHSLSDTSIILSRPLCRL